jgi:hypothetical protein
MGLYTGQEIQPIVPHEEFVWYETDRGFVFRLMGDPPIRVYKSNLHVAVVQTPDQKFTRAAWDPSKTRKMPGWFGRLKEKWFGRPKGFPGLDPLAEDKEKKEREESLARVEEEIGAAEVNARLQDNAAGQGPDLEILDVKLKEKAPL